MGHLSLEPPHLIASEAMREQKKAPPPPAQPAVYPHPSSTAPATSCSLSPSQAAAAERDSEARCCQPTALSARRMKSGCAPKARIVGPPDSPSLQSTVLQSSVNSWRKSEVRDSRQALQLA